MSQAGIVDVIGSHPSIPIEFITDAGSAIPAGNILYVLGGTGISTAGAGDTITISSSSSGFTWNEVTDPTEDLEVMNGYIANNAGGVAFTLPLTSVLGGGFQIVGKGAGGFSIAQNAGQTIHFGSSSTTTGVGGSLTAVEQFAAIEIVCITENTDWAVIDSTGNYVVV